MEGANDVNQNLNINNSIKQIHQENFIGKDNINIKYPFSGIAPNLIDKFLILGYEQRTIDMTVQYCTSMRADPNYETNFIFIDFEENPSVINEICHDYTKKLLDNDYIIEIIFPKMPRMYFINKNKKETDDDRQLIKPYSVIFSINPQDDSGSKKSYNGLGYVFYNKQEHKSCENEEGYLYVPITYVIISEYPYFYHFNEICKNICLLMKNENDEIPLDILLYNIVKFCPSPINKSINLFIGAPLGITTNIIKSKLNALPVNKEQNLGTPSIFFNQLSGYPFLDFNISYIFELMSPDLIIKVFIFTFLEHDIIFYSSSPEILNAVMYFFANINYPLNDSIYYWHILSVSEESFMNSKSVFVGKTSSTITGILGKYNPDVLTTTKIRQHFVLDIDNSNITYLFQEETDEVKKTLELFDYIGECTSDLEEGQKEGDKIENIERKKKIFNDGIQLYEVIYTLMKELQRRAKKVISINKSTKKQSSPSSTPSFFNMYEDESEMELMKVNIRLQKAFYAFIIRIVQKFVSILDVENNDKNNKERKRFDSLVIKEKKEEIKKEDDERKKKRAEHAGIIFKEQFKDCSKYNSFMLSFCIYHDSLDLYKIPFTFINEYIYYSHAAEKSHFNGIDVFYLIDQFYGKRKTIEFEDILGQDKDDLLSTIDSNEIDNIFIFSFNHYLKFYNTQLRKYINREQDDDREIFGKAKEQKKFKKYKRLGYYLSNKILNKYIVFSNNNYEKLKECFKIEKCNIGKDINIEQIEKKVKENSFISDFEIFEKKNDNIIVSVNNLAIQNEKAEKEKNEKNNNDIDYYSIKTKDKKEKNIRFYGGYELIDITNVIEKHFVLERCFSSYGLIKFSLLNILAITRGMEDHEKYNKAIIQTMCDFCEKTRSLVRKYMNIFINIFQNLKSKNNVRNLEEEYNNCLFIITSYFIRNNMIPTEETNNFIKMNEDSTDKETKRPEDDPNFLNNIIESLNENNDDIFFKIKNPELFGKALKTIETVFFGYYTFNEKEKKEESEFTFNSKYLYNKFKQLMINRKDNNELKTFIPETPLSLYVKSTNLLNNYLKNFEYDKNMYNEIGICILSLLYYFKIPIIKSRWIEQYKKKKKNKTRKRK